MLKIGIIYDCNRQKIEQAMALLEEIVRHHPRGGEAEVSFRKFDQSALDLIVNFWADYKTAAEYYQLITSLHLEIKEKFDAARIEFAFPTSTIILKNDLPHSPK